MSTRPSNCHLPLRPFLPPTAGKLLNDLEDRTVMHQ
jgi:hypothetical protein